MSNRSELSSTIRRHAMENPHQLAIQYQEQVFLNYADYIRLTDTIAEQLRSFKIEISDRMLFMFQHHVNYLLAVLPAVETAVFTTSEMISDGRLLKERVNLYRMTWIVTDIISESLIKFSSENGLGLIEMQFESSSSSVMLKKVLSCNVIEKPRSFVWDLALITQTSGTTATPKLIPKSYQLLVENCIQEKVVYDADQNQTRLITAPIHRTNTTFSIIKFLYNQSTIICADSAHPPLIKRLLENGKITHFRSAPATVLSLMDYLETNQINLDSPSLKYVFVSGAAINDRFVSRVDAIFHAQLIHTYGSTESSNVTSNYKITGGYRSGSVGVSTYLDTKIINNEICVQGKTVFEGYENADNSEYFIDGYYRTGDAGHMDEDGYLYITGRIKEMINRGGEKVSPYEIEKEIENLHLFKEQAVFPYPGENLMEEIGLAAVLRDQKNPVRLSDIRRHLMDRYPSFKLPTKLILVDEIPKSRSHKIQRKHLYEQIKGFEKDEVSEIAADALLTTDTENLLLNLVRSILKVPNIKTDDHFIAIGGDSLKAAELYTAIETAVGIQLPMVELFACADFKEMADYIDRYKKKEESFKFVVPLVEGNSEQVPLIFVHAVAGDAVTYRLLASKIRDSGSIYAIEFNVKRSKWQFPVKPDQILSDYIDELLLIWPKGNFIFCGLSMGGRIALEIAHRLQQQGFPVSTVICLDTVFIRGNKRGKKINIGRSLMRLILDLKTKRLGSIFQLIAFKFKRFYNNRLAANHAKRQMRLSIQKKISSGTREFTPAETELLVSSSFTMPIRQQYEANVVYLLATKEKNTENAEFLLPRVRSFRQVEVDGYHQDFVSLLAQPTAAIIDEIIKDIK